MPRCRRHDTLMMPLPYASALLFLLIILWMLRRLRFAQHCRDNDSPPLLMPFDYCLTYLIIAYAIAFIFTPFDVA